jgi:hypothetical protein
MCHTPIHRMPHDTRAAYCKRYVPRDMCGVLTQGYFVLAIANAHNALSCECDERLGAVQRYKGL